MTSLADILNTTQQGVTAVNNLNAALSKAGNAWTPYTPIVTASAGTIVATATGAFSQIGKTVFIQMNIIVSSGGAGSGFIIATLPVNALSGVNFILAGRERASVGKMLQGLVGSSIVDILNYDNSYPAGNGFQLTVSGVYESA